MSIRLKFEAGIDVDEKRQIWISGKAEADPGDTDMGRLGAEMCKAVTGEALAAYEQLFPRPKPGAVPKDGEQATKAALAGEAKEVEPMRTFED